MIVAHLSAGPLDATSLANQIRRPECGGLVVFEGTTRSPSEGKVVARLEYEAFEARAGAQLRALAADAIKRWSLCGAVAVHRTGVVGPGEASVVVACSAPHRAEAFEAARWLIDTIKAEVAVWKKEVFADGSTAWAGVNEPAPHEPG